MIVSAWSDGRGFVYGFRILGKGRSLYFREEWSSVLLSLPDTPDPVAVPITPSFWGRCPVLRARAIRSFLARNGLIPWPKDHPPHFALHAQGGGRFQLEWLEHRPVQPTLGLFDRSEPVPAGSGGTEDREIQEDRPTDAGRSIMGEEEHVQ